MKFSAVVSTLLVASAAAFAPATTEVGILCFVDGMDVAIIILH